MLSLFGAQPPKDYEIAPEYMCWILSEEKIAHPNINKVRFHYVMHLVRTLRLLFKTRIMEPLTTESRHLAIADNVKLSLRYSVRVTIVSCVIFMIAKLFGLERITELRFINYLAMIVIIYSAIKDYYKNHFNKIEYFTGFGLAFLIGCFGQLWYAILFLVYLQFDTGLLEFLASQFPGKTLNPSLSSAFVLFIEGIAFSSIVALTIMQYFKRKRGRWASTKG